MNWHSFLSLAKPTLALALPIMAGQVSQMLMGIVDSAMLGKIGVLPLAASAFAGNLIAFPFVFGIGLLSAISVRVSQAHGAGEPHKIAELLRHGLWLSLGAGVGLFALIYLASFFLDRLGQAPEVAFASRNFFLIIGASLIPTLPAFAFKNFCESLDKPWVPMLVLGGAVPLNILLNWILIYGNLGAPALGLEGAAMATLAARAVSLLALVFWIWKNPFFEPYRPRRLLGHLDGFLLRNLLKIGVPSAFQLSIEVAAFSFGAILVGMLGKNSLAAHQIAISCAATTFMLPLGISVATSIRVGTAAGAKDWNFARAIGFNSMILALGVMSLTALIFIFLGETIARLFVKEGDLQVAQIAAALLMVAAIFQLSDGVQIVAGGALRGISDATIPMLGTIVAYWAIALPIGYYLAFHQKLGATGIWIGFAIGLTLGALFMATRFAWKTSQKPPSIK